METLQQLQENVYRKQFYDFDEPTERCNDVLKALQKLKTNPLLLDYVIKCLNEQKICINEKFYYIVVIKTQYGKEFETIINKTFSTKEKAMQHADDKNNHPDYLLFEKYTIKKIN